MVVVTGAVASREKETGKIICVQAFENVFWKEQGINLSVECDDVVSDWGLGRRTTKGDAPVMVGGQQTELWDHSMLHV